MTEVEFKQLSNGIRSGLDYGVLRGKDIRSIPPATAKDLALDLHDRQAVGKVPKDCLEEFNRLKRLARAIGVQKVVVTPDNPGLEGWYDFGSDIDFEFARGWGLTKEDINSLNKKEGGVILIFYLANPFCRHFAHEIGHHLYRLAEFGKKEQSIPVTGTMKGFFPTDVYVHFSRDEICAESFAHFLTDARLKIAVKRHCESILRRINHYDPNAASLIRSYRNKCLPFKP